MALDLAAESGMAELPSLATQLLRDDHKILRGLFRQVVAAGRRAHEMRDGVVREILMLLEVHTRVEEEIFYPAVQDASSPGDPVKTLAEQCIADHRGLGLIIARIRKIPLGESALNAELAELMESVEEHLEREESELFPSAERSLGNLLQVVGDRIRARREALLAQPKYRESQPSLVQDPHGGEQMRKRRAG